jgi:glycerol-3-phosphate acyltransferase PlsX
VSLDGNRRSVVVAVDAMGGDHAPDEIVKGAVEAHRRGVGVLLVGPSELLAQKLAATGVDIPTVEAPDVVGMDEAVSQALRRRQASLRVAVDLVSDERADAVVSCGNSAAIMATTFREWGMQAGIDRPAFGGMLPTRNGGVFVLDIGANTQVKASNLVQFAIMGDVYVKVARGIESPRIAILSNGSEDSKGTKEIKDANDMLRRMDLNFTGNVEGNHIFDGMVDVVVTDGFTGNVLLKSGEGVAMEMFRLIKEELTRDLVSRVASAALIPAFDRVRRKVDYEEYGGAPVFGVNGVMVNCHGRSRAKAVTNALLLAQRMVEQRLVEQIGNELTEESAAIGRRVRLRRALHLRHEPTGAQ